MNITQLISIGLATFIAVITIYGWMDRIQGTNAKINEGFTSTSTTDALASDDVLERLKQVNEQIPTPDEAVKAHRALLLFIQSDFGRGIKFVDDFGRRFFGDNMKLRNDLDTRTLMDTYVNPLI
jgi:hypothetical protein